MTGDEPLIVVDCSVIVDALVMAELGDLRRDLSGLTLFAPALLDYEVLSALRGLTLGGRLSSHRATEALGDYLDLPIVKVSRPSRPARRGGCARTSRHTTRRMPSWPERWTSPSGRGTRSWPLRWVRASGAMWCEPPKQGHGLVNEARATDLEVRMAQTAEESPGGPSPSQRPSTC